MASNPKLEFRYADERTCTLRELCRLDPDTAASLLEQAERERYSRESTALATGDKDPAWTRFRDAERKLDTARSIAMDLLCECDSEQAYAHVYEDDEFDPPDPCAVCRIRNALGMKEAK